MDSPPPRFRLVRALALASFLGWSVGAHAADLVVQGPNSPYSFTAGTSSYDNIYVGQGAIGILNQIGGTLTASTGQLFLGANPGSSGTYNLSGGTLNTISTDVGDYGTGVFTLSDNAVHNVTGTDATANGSLDIGFFSGSNGTYNLNGGTLTAGYVRGGQGTSTFNFNNGTLTAGASANDFFQGLTSAYVQAGGALINTNGFNDTVAQALLTGTAAGTADGGLFKSGTGTLTLTGANTYSGVTTIVGGTLQVGNGGTTGTLGTGAVSNYGTLTFNRSDNFLVANAIGGGGNLIKLGNGTLGLTGSSSYAGSTTVSAGTLAVTGSVQTQSGTLTVDGLVSAAATVALGSTGGFLSVGNTYVGNAGTGTFTQSGGMFSTFGSLTLGNNAGSRGTGSLNGSGSSLSATGVFVGNAGTGAFTQTAGTLQIADTLTLGNVSGGSGTYSLNGSGSRLNTTRIIVGNAGTGTFTQTGGSVTAGGLALTLGSAANGSGTYNLSGSGSSLSATGIIVGNAGTGTFTQTGGSVTTQGLPLTLGNVPGSSGTYTLGVGILNAGMVGTGGGASVFHFAGGTLQADHDTTNFLQGLTTADVQVGGARIDTNGSAVTVAQNLVHDPANNAPTVDGGLIKLGNGTLTLTGADTYTGGTIFQAGTLDVGSPGALGTTGALKFTGGILQYSAANTTDYSGRFSTGAGQAYSIDTNGQNVTFATGLTSNGGSLTKLGAGTLTLPAANTYTGATTVGAGTLQVSGSVTGGNVNVGAGATLAIGGTGSVKPGSSATLTVDGTAGSPASVTLAATGNLSTGVAYVGLDGAGTFTQSGGTFTTNGNGFFLGYHEGSSGTYTLGGTGSLSVGYAYVGDFGAATFTQNGGTFTTNGGNFFLGVSQGNAVFNLNGGTLTAANVIGGGRSTFHFNGGTLQAGSNYGSGDFSGNLTTVDVQAGGAIFDTQDGRFVVTVPLLHNTTSGAPAADGGLTKLGTGTLELTNANTYTGNNTVLAGTLRFDTRSSPAGSVVVGGATVASGATLVFFGVTVTPGFNSLTAQTGGTIQFTNNTRVIGGYLDGFGSYTVSQGGATFTATTVENGANVAVTDNGLAAFKNVTSSGAVTVADQTTLDWNGGSNALGTLTVDGRANTSAWTSTGVIAIDNGGTLANSGSNLLLGGGSRTTVNAGGTLSTTDGTSIELNGALLVNNGTQTGALNVNYGSQARGSGFFGNVTVGPGGQFGNNSAGGGGNTNAAPAATNFWRALDRAQQAAVNPLPFIGPRLSTTPQVVNVANLTLGPASTLNFNLQNTQGPAGQGYDLTNVGNQLSLTGSTTPGNQIVIRLISLDQNGNNGAVANFDGTQPYQFVLVQTGNGITGYTAGEFTVNTASFANNTQGGAFSVVQQGNNLVLVFVPVPEPGTWALLLVGTGGLLLIARQRSRRMAA